MYKVAIFALVAFAACSVAAAEEETSLLLGNEKLFADFCRESNEYILNDVRKNARETSSNLFKQFFGSANDIAEEVLNVEKDAVEQLSQQIASPDAPIDESKLSENEIAKRIEEGKQEIQQRGVLGGIVPGVKAATSAMVAAANSALFVKIAQARAYLTPSALLSGINQTCDMIKNYESELEGRLNAAKDAISTAHPDDAEVQNFLGSVTVTNLRCMTTKNVVRLNGFCELFKSGRGPFFKMLGISAQ